MKVFNLPKWIVDSIYIGILERDCVITTMSIGIDQHNTIGPKYTGGGRYITPLHEYQGQFGYVSVQTYVNKLNHGIIIDEDEFPYWNENRL